MCVDVRKQEEKKEKKKKKKEEEEGERKKLDWHADGIYKDFKKRR